jgi:hypothetical protein
MLTLAIRRHLVAKAPPTVPDAIGFIVIQPVARAAIISVSTTSYDAARRQDREQPDHEGGR